MNPPVLETTPPISPPTVMGPGSGPPQHYQPPMTVANQPNGGPATHAQAMQAPPFPNGHYYPPGLFFHHQTIDGQNAPPPGYPQNTLPPGYPYHHWYPMQQHPFYQTSAPTPTPQPPASSSTAMASVAAPSTTTRAPALPEPAFGIDPAILANGELLPLAPPAPGASESTKSPNVATPPPADAREPVGSLVNTPSTPNASAPGERSGETSSDVPIQGKAAPRPSKRRRTEDESGAEESPDDEAGEDDDDTPATAANKAKRLVACKSKPIYEHVVGAGSGGELRDAQEQSDAEKVYRTRELPEPFVLQAASTRHYRRNIPEIITRIENLASRCGCLAYFAIQHFESGENFYYYISDALRDWAPGDVRDIHKRVATTFSNVMAAYQATKVQLQHEVEMANIKAANAEEKASALEEKAAALEAKAAALEEEHERLLEEHVQCLAELE